MRIGKFLRLCLVMLFVVGIGVIGFACGKDNGVDGAATQRPIIQIPIIPSEGDESKVDTPKEEKPVEPIVPDTTEVVSIEVAISTLKEKLFDWDLLVGDCDKQDNYIEAVYDGEKAYLIISNEIVDNARMDVVQETCFSNPQTVVYGCSIVLSKQVGFIFIEVERV